VAWTVYVDPAIWSADLRGIEPVTLDRLRSELAQWAETGPPGDAETVLMGGNLVHRFASSSGVTVIFVTEEATPVGDICNVVHAHLSW
jgi:hypothetical protein